LRSIIDKLEIRISKLETNLRRVSENQEIRMQDIRVTGYQGKVRKK